MAMVYCDRHGPPRGRIHRYPRSVRPIGYPNRAVLCAKAGCDDPGMVWLNEVDVDTYDLGERALVIWGQSVKIAVL